jgi:nitrogen fixation/metabolism regulation signal transduction histidine kinase
MNKTARRILSLTVGVWLGGAAQPAYSLTVEEILALKKAGVSEETLQMLLEREREERTLALRAGAWKTADGRMIYSIDGSPASQQQDVYPLCVYPQVDVPRQRKK